MKRFLCILLTALLLLCGCTGAVTSVETETQSLSNQNTSDSNVTETMGDASASPVRYVNAYEVTALDETYTAGQVYMEDGKFYKLSSEIVGESRVTKVTVYDETGTITDTVAVPQLADLPRAVPSYVHLLPDERFFMVYNQQTFVSTERMVIQAVMYIVDANGTILVSKDLPTAADQFQFYIDTNVDGETKIFMYCSSNPQYSGKGDDYWEEEIGDGIFIGHNLKSTACFYYYNDALELISEITPDQYQNKIDFNIYGTINALQDGKFRIGSKGDQIVYVDMEAETLKQGKLRLDDSLIFMYTLYQGDDGNDYISTPNGIFRYEDGYAPTPVLNWLDAGLKRVNADEQLWIIDDTAFFFTKTDKVDGRSAKQLYHVHVTKKPEPQQKVIKIFDYSIHTDDWFLDAIFAFHAMQTEYRIELVCADIDMDDTVMTDAIQKMLLYDDQTDIIFCQRDWLLSPYYDKGAFLDLNTYFADRFLGCISSAFGFGDALYVAPMKFALNTFAALSDTVDGYLTWDKLYALTDSLTDGEALTSDPRCVESIRANGLMDFVDFKTNTAYYDTDGFQNMVEYTAAMEEWIDENYGVIKRPILNFSYQITNGTLPACVRDGGIKLLHVPMYGLDTYAILKLIYGEKAFSLCGYPSVSGGGADISGYQKMAIRSNTDVLDGCIAFMEFLLSDEIQSAPDSIDIGMPVTVSGMSHMIDENRYWYFPKSMAEKLERGTNTMVSIQADGSSAEYSGTYGTQSNTELQFGTVYLTDEDRQKLMDFFTVCEMKSGADTFIESIVKEELSYWEGGISSLADASEKIQSRVWIYLNE